MEILSVEGLVKYFSAKKKLFSKSDDKVHALNGVTFTVRSGDSLGIVGESGSGKTTLGRCILRLIEPTSGNIKFKGTDLLSLQRKELRVIRKQIQMIFQDPSASLNPNMTVGTIIEEPMKYHFSYTEEERREKVRSLLEKVGLDISYYYRFPHQLSGGQQQRIGIARAIGLNPQLIIADEPVSALDVSVQAQILNLFVELQETFDFTYIIISHDLSVIKHLCNRIIVMYLGEIVEIAGSDELFENPTHPYTQALISAIPMADILLKRDKIILKGDIPSNIHLPKGCKFHTRCPYCLEICEEVPPSEMRKNDHMVKCHLYDDRR